MVAHARHELIRVTIVSDCDYKKIASAMMMISGINIAIVFAAFILFLFKVLQVFLWVSLEV